MNRICDLVIVISLVLIAACLFIMNVRPDLKMALNSVLVLLSVVHLLFMAPFLLRGGQKIHIYEI